MTGSGSIFIDHDGARVQLRSVVVDVAQLLLELVDQSVVSRPVLAAVWKRVAADLRTGRGSARYVAKGKGDLASRELGEALLQPEKGDAARRLGTPPDHQVRILRPDLLRKLIATWDAAETES